MLAPLCHGGKAEDKNFAEYFEVRILKAYKKPFTMCVEEGTYISSHKGELLGSVWHQSKLIRTTTRVVQGRAAYNDYHDGNSDDNAEENDKKYK